jgi:cell division septum initiation protein DivIVA
MPQPADILASYYADAEARLRELILHPTGRTDRARAFSQARASALLAEIRRIQRQLKIDAAAVTGPALADAYRTGRAEASEQLAEAGVAAPGEPFKGSFNSVDRESLEVVARDTAGDLNRAADGMADFAAQTLRATQQQQLSETDINRIIATGIISGDPSATQREVRDALIKAHKGNLVTAGGRTFEAAYYAKMVVVTKTRQAVTLGALNRFRAANILLVAITGKLSKNFCTAFLEKVFYIGDGQHPKYPHYSTLPGGGPPFHPNCSKGVRAFIEPLAGAKQIEAARGAPDADLLLRPVAESGAPSPALTPARRQSVTDAQRTYKDLQIRQQVEAIQRKLDRATDSLAEAVQSVVAQARRIGVETIDLPPGTSTDPARPAPRIARENANTARKVVSSLVRANRRGLRPPKSIVLRPGQPRPAQLDGDTLTIDPAAEIWRRGNRERLVVSAIVAARFTIRSTDRTAELAAWATDRDRRIALKLGPAAGLSPRQFVIECRARLYLGEMLPPDVSALYRRLTR